MDDIEESEQEEELEYEPEGTIPRIMKPSNIITDRKPGDWETATTFFKDKCEAIVYDSESIQGRYDISEEEE